MPIKSLVHGMNTWLVNYFSVSNLVGFISVLTICEQSRNDFVRCSQESWHLDFQLFFLELVSVLWALKEAVKPAHRKLVCWLSSWFCEPDTSNLWPSGHMWLSTVHTAASSSHAGCFLLHPTGRCKPNFAVEWENPDTGRKTWLCWTVIPQDFKIAWWYLGIILLRNWRDGSMSIWQLHCCNM